MIIYNSECMRKRDYQPARFDAQSDAVTTVVRVSDTQRLALLIDERDEILEYLEISETRDISSFRLTTPDQFVSNFDLLAQDSSRPYISHPQPLRNSSTRRPRRKRSLNPAFAASSLAPPSPFVAPSRHPLRSLHSSPFSLSYYTLNRVQGVTISKWLIACSASPDLPPETRAALIQSLDGWNFEPNTLPTEDHVAACAVLIFEALFRIEGMEEAVGVKLAQIPPFITHLRHIYRWQNSYHNFEHALDVLQATYSYLRAADMVPPLSILLTPLPPTSSPPQPSSSTSSPPRSARAARHASPLMCHGRLRKRNANCEREKERSGSA
ncbi:hypothetical protein C8F04DRAFT_1316461 [Mycena alexandri]|uniref:PDEase domain-containing protein n=1 Tax=Mycena alexandri TaxID=1745969 RepID=A0AAD6WQ04_9AGAR|nr:hypothetical protein C8F04DRAFT_1316461 [Mycena alexandri]